MEKGTSIQIANQHYIVVGKIKPVNFLTFWGVLILIKLKDFFFPNLILTLLLFYNGLTYQLQETSILIYIDEKGVLQQIILKHQLTELLLNVTNLQKQNIFKILYRTIDMISKNIFIFQFLWVINVLIISFCIL